MKIANALFACLFLFAALLQFNDPDPLYWVLIYGGAAAAVSLRALGRLTSFWAGVVIGGALAGMSLTAKHMLEWLKSDDLSLVVADMSAAEYVEPAREFIGLAIVLLVLVAQLRPVSRQKTAKPDTLRNVNE